MAQPPPKNRVHFDPVPMVPFGTPGGAFVMLNEGLKDHIRHAHKFTQSCPTTVPRWAQWCFGVAGIMRLAATVSLFVNAVRRILIHQHADIEVVAFAGLQIIEIALRLPWFISDGALIGKLQTWGFLVLFLALFILYLIPFADHSRSPNHCNISH